MGNFNLSDWVKQKLEEEKDTIDKIKNAVKSTWEDFKQQVTEMKDDSHYMVPILNGIMGDTMAEKGSDSLINLSFRHQSRDVSVEKLSEQYDFTKFNGKVILIIHGLMNDESIWQSAATDKALRLGTALEKEKKANILYIRYNTGLHISENGRKVSNLIQALIEKYPEIKELVIISHSMGGLVSRSAGYYADIQRQSWISILKKVFLIGVPNEGSYLAKVAHITQYFFRKIDPTEKDSVAKFFDVRSNGIKDLSFGYLVDEDWQNTENENKKNVETTKVFPIANVDYYLIAGTIAEKEKRSRIFTFFGDGLVEKESALSNLFKTNSLKSGKVEMKLFAKENHLSLLESEMVREYLKESLGWRKD
jgi:pimeloyl-ACP methyl ester carboxylesterase